MPVRRTATVRLASALRRLRAEADWCLRAVLSAALACAPLSLRADGPGPQGNVVAGDASFNHQGNYTGIRASDGAIIEYDRFNIPAGHTVEFIQPHGTARVLNRVTGADPSSLLGTLRANGIVYFVNPAGIYFGRDAVVDVGQLYAAAGSLSNADFLARNDHFTRLSGRALNEGSIRADAIHLVGQTVRNAGTLSAPARLVLLAAGGDVLIGRAGEYVYVNATAATTAFGEGMPGVENAGRIESPLALLAAGDLYAMAVLQSGVIKAREVELEGRGGGEVWNTGEIDATAPAGMGGSVSITGRYVGLGGHSVIDVSGADEGGSIWLGRGYQRADPNERMADIAWVRQGAVLRAESTETGCGGIVVVHADKMLLLSGDISVAGVDGEGFVEISQGNAFYFDLNEWNGYADAEFERGKEMAQAAADDIRRIDAENAISAATRAQLRRLGIFARGTTAGEIAAIMRRRGVLAQLIPGEVRQPENYQVADGRISEQAARAAIAAYEAVFIHRDPATGAAVSRVPALQAALTAAYGEFRSARPSAPPGAFARFIREQSPAGENALLIRRLARDLAALFGRIESLGLTASEVLVARTVILRPLRIPGLPSDLLGDLVAGNPGPAPAAPVRLAAHY
jgi:filamentous hemagglutinin family protein